MLWHCETKFQQTKRGKIRQVVRERYLRDDIDCNSEKCLSCLENRPQAPSNNFNKHDNENDVPSLSAKTSTLLGEEKERIFRQVLLPADPVANRYYIPTVDVVVSQMDVLQHAVVDNVIILETVWEAVKDIDLAIYNRLRSLFRTDRHFVLFANEHHRETFCVKKNDETAVERTERAIVHAASWYFQHLDESIEIVLLSCEEKEGHLSIGAFVAQHIAAHPELGDLVAAQSTSTSSKNKNGTLFTEHWSVSEMQAGIESGRCFKGAIRCDRDCWLESHVVIKSADGARIGVRLHGRDAINRAIDGDVVVIQILPEAEWTNSSDTFAVNTETLEGETTNVVEEETPEVAGPTDLTASSSTAKGVKPCGRVVGIMERQLKTYCGSLEIPDDENLTRKNYLVCPVSRKVPKIKIQTSQAPLLADKRIQVAVDSWPVDSAFPLGHYVQTLGVIGDKVTETRVLLLEHDIPTEEFSEKVLACLPSIDWKITEENCIGRQDFRHLPVMSIDPPGCKDIDDALHIRALPNGNMELGVHIADVTYFVAPDSPLDKEAADRGTSTYLVDRRLDMLPSLLTTELCSLRANEDHLAFTVIWEMTPVNTETGEGGEIVNVGFCKSVIHSIKAFSYGDAQTRLEAFRKKPTSREDDPEGWSIFHMNQYAQILKQRRLDAGALTLASPEVRFVLDTETQNPLDVQMYALKETNALVEEFMLLANITVAKKILRHYPTLAMLRRHPAPSKSQFDDLIAAAATVNVEIVVDSSKSLADSLDAAKRVKHATKTEDYLFNKMLRILTTRCMMPAAYFCSGTVSSREEYHHYGLAAPLYTHFTSPIRRYADVVVHRLLSACIGVSPLPRTLEQKGDLSDLADNLNARHTAAQLAGRASVSLHTILYFETNPVPTTEAVVIKLKANGVRVLLPKFGIEGMILLCAKGQEDNTLSFDPIKQTLSPLSEPSIKVSFLDRVTVSIRVERKGKSRHPKLIIELVTPTGFGTVTTTGTKDTTKVTLVKATPAKATPTKATPTKATPKKSSKTKSSKKTPAKTTPAASTRETRGSKRKTRK